MGSDVRRQIDAHLRRPTLHIKECCIRHRERVSGDQRRAAEILVEQSEACGSALLTANEPRPVVLCSTSGGSNSGLKIRPNPAFHRTDDLVHDFDRACLSIGIRRQQVLLRRDARQPSLDAA
jgi:hypothetical protein